MTPAAMRAAERFMQLNARLLDRHRFAFHFGCGPATPIVTCEWRAWMTLQRLRTLRAYGRLAP